VGRAAAIRQHARAVAGPPCSGLPSTKDEAMSATRLCSQTLAGLDDRVATPGYDRSQVTVGIAHFGVGGLHRAPGDVPGPAAEPGPGAQVGDLRHRGDARDEAVCEALTSQDNFFTLITRGGDGRPEARVIASIVHNLYARAPAPRWTPASFRRLNLANPSASSAVMLPQHSRGTHRRRYLKSVSGVRCSNSGLRAASWTVLSQALFTTQPTRCHARDLR
jgi:hypothetical protein